MDAIFVAGVHSKAAIDTELMDLLQTKGYNIKQLPVMFIEEGESFHPIVEVHQTTFSVAESIHNRLGNTYTRAMVLLDIKLDVLYVMFTRNRDSELPNILTMICEELQ